MRANITNPESIVEIAIANEIEAAKTENVPSREAAKKIMSILSDIRADFRPIRPRGPRAANAAAGSPAGRGRRSKTV
ncbi:MAG: hypothetical protein IMX01_09595 [Limnochordaceae bacterium]|nr:hypothetical protein [Limnochordaceae bacterium]